MPEKVYDLIVIGGGINGTGIAADAAGRGLKVLLAEMGDLASATSSSSSKLIHGGLRYLEHYEFRLVRESLKEREILLAKAPHIIRPLRFVLPLGEGMRPASMIRAGLFLYDHLARRKAIAGSSSVDLTSDPAGQALRPSLTRGFAYWDCWVDDARLVVLNARAAAERGATILTRTKVTRAVIAHGLWRVTLDGDGEGRVVGARALINAAGPWAGKLAERLSPGNSEHRPPALKLRLVKGSHIVVPRITATPDAYLMQSPDGRAVFALPFEDDFTLIGTTDAVHQGDPASAIISPEEEDYLLQLANAFFRRQLKHDDIVWRFSGVRPLQDDGTENASAVSRDYRLDLQADADQPALLSVIGGKITTYRKLAEAALQMLSPHLPPMGPPWTHSAPLPGGDVGAGGMAGLCDELGRRRPRMPAGLLAQYARRYGSLSDGVLGEAKCVEDLGEDFGGQLYEREVAYLRDHEWARTPEDVLWRRTKTALHLNPRQRTKASEAISRHL